MGQNILYPVQYLRAVAALAVFYFHLSVTMSGKPLSGATPIEQIGAAGVDLFFVISGFIMAMIVWNRPVSFSGFMRDRLARIVPLYWAVTLVVFAIAVFAPTLLGSTTADPAQLLHSLFFIPYGMGGDRTVPTLLVGWTLNYEMFFYGLIAIFAGIGNDRSLTVTSAFICCLAVAGFIFQPANPYVKFYLEPILLEFPMGVAVFHCWRVTSGSIGRWFPAVLFVVAIVAIVFSFNIDVGHMRVVYWGLPSALLLFSALHLVTFKSEPLKHLGDWSYSIYLLHIFVIMGVYRLILPTLSPLTIPLPLIVILITAALIVGSALTYRLFEHPMARWLKTRSAHAGATAAKPQQ